MSTITSLNSTARFRESVRTLTRAAIRNGFLRKRPCSCTRVDSIAHHDDYAKPFSVKWLCAGCHPARHRELGWGIRAKSNWGKQVAFSQLQRGAFNLAMSMATGRRAAFRKSFSILALLATQQPKAALAVFETQEAK